MQHAPPVDNIEKKSIKEQRKELFQAWWQASRPPFYIATLVPVFLGFIAAGKTTGSWDVLGLLFIMFICFLLHLSANLANDLFDHMQGVDAGANIGGSRVIQEGKITPKDLSYVLVIIFLATLLCTSFGVNYFNRPNLWWVSLFAIFSSIFYVAPPIKYGHRALGEVFVFLNMGLTMTAGTFYAFTGFINSKIICLSVPIGLMVAGILYYQSLPEIETDKAAGKNTLANTLGPKKAIQLFHFWWPVVWVSLIACWLLGYSSWVILIGIFASIPLYMKANSYLLAANGEWLSLDKHGHLIRKMYLLLGVFFLLGVAV